MREMKLSAQDRMQLLTIHKQNLIDAKTFEEYREAHVAYIEMLIGQFKAEVDFINVTEAFAYK